jgi:hypothetical protein
VPGARTETTGSNNDSDEDRELDLDENAFCEFELYKSFCPRVVLRKYEKCTAGPVDMEMDYFMAVRRS